MKDQSTKAPNKKGVTKLTIAETARELLQHDMMLVRIPYKSKRPVEQDWPNQEYSLDDVDTAFSKKSNLGINLGFGNIVDIDCDSQNTIKLAMNLLPNTPMKMGRRSAGITHYFYRVTDIDYSKFIDPETNKCLIEIRSGKGKQTIVSPSIHPSGEEILWVAKSTFIPAKISAEKLIKAVKQIAAASLLLEAYKPGTRQELIMSMAGWLAKSGWKQEEATEFLICMMKAADDDEVGMRTNAIQKTYEKYQSGSIIRGFTGIAELVGQKRISKIALWLDLCEEDQSNTIEDSSDSPASWADAFDDIDEMTWIWDGYIPNGYCTMIASPPGVGKSLLLLHIVKTYLDGGKWPDGSTTQPSDKNVLWIEAESGQAMNILRAKRWGVDLSRVFAPLKNPLDDFFLEDEEHRECCIQNMNREDVGLIILDSLSGIHDMDENNSRVKKVVKFFAAIAKTLNKPVIISHHMNKSGEGLNAVRGSGAITQFPRVVFSLEANDDLRRISMIKNNIGEKLEPLQMIINNDGLEFFEYDPSDWDVEEEDFAERHPKLAEAMAWLESMLFDGPVPSAQLKNDCKSAKISISTLKRAKKKLKIVAVEIDGIHHWKLPAVPIAMSETNSPSLFAA